MERNDRNRNQFSPAVLVLILLFFLFPPLAIIVTIFYVAYKRGKNQNGVEKRNAAGRTAKEQFLRRMKGEDVAEVAYKSHGHTPVSYSYDACAQEKRLEQLKVLKSAGLLDELEYQQRRQDILK